MRSSESSRATTKSAHSRSSTGTVRARTRSRFATPSKASAPTRRPSSRPSRDARRPERSKLKTAYEAEYGEGAFDKDLKGDLSAEDLDRAKAGMSGDVAGKKAAELEQAFRGIGTDEDAVRKVFEGTTETERDLIIKTYGDKYDRPLSDAMKSELSGKELQEMQTRSQKGTLDAADDLYFKANNGETSDTLSLLQGKSGPEINALRTQWQERGYGNLDDKLMDGTSGRDKFEMKFALQGNLSDMPPEARAEEQVMRANSRATFERDGFGGWFMDAIGSDKGKLVDKNLSRTNQAYQSALMNDGVIDRNEARDYLENGRLHRK